MNKQQIFDKAYLGLKSQGFKQSRRRVSSQIRTLCSYRGGEGRKCAVGWLIPDSIYKPSFELMSLSKLMRKLGVSDSLDSFVYSLRLAHDQSHFPEDMSEELVAIAKKHNLKIPQ